jgi:hypothetical protein
MLFNEKNQKNCRMVGCSITMHPATPLSICQFLMDKNVLMLPQPTYSPESPCDLWLLPTMKEKMKGKQFHMNDDIISNICCLQVIPKTSRQDFQKSFQQWQEHWNKCVCMCACKRMHVHAPAPEWGTLKRINDEIGI